MKKKTFALLGASALAVLALASCTGGSKNPTTNTGTGTDPVTTGTDPVTTGTNPVTSTTPVADNSTLHIAVNYKGQQGISARETYQNPVENRNYAVGDILPTWSDFSKRLGGTKLVDVADYAQDSDKKNGEKIKTDNYKSGNENIDIFTTTTELINKYGEAGEIVDLNQYLDKMPNFKKFLDENKTIKNDITNQAKKAIYYTPYFDGYNKIERMFLMDTTMVEKLLDSAADTGDTSISGKGAAANTLQENKYTPFINDKYNYPDATTTVKISKNAVASNMTIKQTTNIIKQQNELLSASGGTTGKALLNQFKAYLTAAFGDNVGEGKTYSKLSEIFTSESAAYNTDEMIALMRVVKANPGVVTGNTEAEVEIMVPREGANNRVDNIADLIQIFGIMGMDAEAEMLYYGPDGTIHDAAATTATYEGIEILQKLYSEGLLLNQFYINNSGVNMKYLNLYFGHTAQTKAGADGYGFMMYDYSASTTAMNTLDEDGLGTADSKRVGAFKDVSVTGFMPVLPPLTYWATGDSWKATDALSSRTGKTLVRYSDSNRAMKNATWCIPKSSDNINKAVELLDLLYSENGVRVNDFGPTSYWKSSTDLGTYAGEETPEFSDTLKTWISSSDKDFWSFMRAYLGATHGIGYVRSASINYQATNKYGKIGTLNIENAISSGAVVLATVDINNFEWDQCVPTAGYGTPTKPNDYGAVTNFWKSEKWAADASGWVKVVIDPTVSDSTSLGNVTETGDPYTYAQVKNQAKGTRLTGYLYEKLFGLDPMLIPAEVDALL